MLSATTPAVPTWLIYRELLARSGRSAPWATAGDWALDHLEGALGLDWPARAARAEDPQPLATALPWIGSHTLAFTDVLEWALGLHLLRDRKGMAKLRREAAANATAGRGLHTALQLKEGALASRLGWGVEFETGGLSPADVAITTPVGRLLVETHVLTERYASRTNREKNEELTNRLQWFAAEHDLWLSGQIERTLAAGEIAFGEDWIASAAMTPADLCLDGLTLQMVPRDNASGALSGPRVDDDLGPRMAARIADKAQQMRRSGATWLRVVLLTGLWPMTEWGRATLIRKLETMATWLVDELGDARPDGIVLSSAAAFYNGSVNEEMVTSEHGIGLRRAIQPLRARETLIIPLRAEGEQAADCWMALADAESSYLAYALSAVGLPRAETIFGSVPGQPD